MLHKGCGITIELVPSIISVFLILGEVELSAHVDVEIDAIEAVLGVPLHRADDFRVHFYAEIDAL